MIKSLVLALSLFHACSLFCSKPQRNGWISFEALSARDHVTQVFEAINPNISKSDPYSTTVNGTLYTILAFTAQTYYNDIYQKDSYVDDYTANVTGGSLTLAFSFNYSHGNNSGYAYGHLQTDQFWFTKKLLQVDGFLTWDPATINNITIKEMFSISNSIPKLSSEANSAYQQILNNHVQEENRLKSNLLSQINVLYRNELTSSLHNEDLISINNITYTYKSTSFNYTNAIMDPKLSNVGFKGLYYSFLFELENYTTECNDLPTKYNESLGGMQSFFGFGWIKASVLFAAKSGLFDAVLDSKWDIQMFQFYMGDLANVIDEAKKYTPNNPVNGTCKCKSPQSVTVQPHQNSSLQILIPYECQLFTNKTLIQTITFKTLFVQKFSLASNYTVTNITYAGIVGTNFTSAGNFVVTDKLLATQYIVRMVNSLVGKPALGNKFPTIRRNRGAMNITDDYVYMYDPSQK